MAPISPRRLTTARCLADHTPASLAATLGCSLSDVLLWERGIHVPSADLIEDLANLADTDPAFITPDIESGREHHATYPAPPRVHGVCSVIHELISYISHTVQLPEVTLPTSPATWCPTQSAQATRTLWGLHHEPLTHLVSHAETHGITCAVVPDLGSTTAAIIDDLWPTVVIDLRATLTERRWGIARELGRICAARSGTPYATTDNELLDRYAAELLMPHHALHATHTTTQGSRHLNQLAATWHVSPAKLADQLQRIGAHTPSTVDDHRIIPHNEIKPRPHHNDEQPETLTCATNLIAEHHNVTIEDIALETSLPPQILAIATTCNTPPRPQVAPAAPLRLVHSATQ